MMRKHGILFASFLLLALIISGSLITANAQVTATRTISDTTPAPGDTINVTVTIDTGGATLHAMSLQEVLDCGWPITRGTETPAASNFKAATNEWVWFADVTGTVTVNYTITIPAGAGGVTCNFAGTVKSSNPATNVGVAGDNQVTVSGGPPAEVTATRTIPNKTPTAGETFNVTVTITPNVAAVHGMGLQETLGCGWAITRGTETPAADQFKLSTNEWVWLADVTTPVTVNYTVQVPPGTAVGTVCNFTGTVSGTASPLFTVPVGGDNQVVVGGAVAGAPTAVRTLAHHSGTTIEPGGILDVTIDVTVHAANTTGLAVVDTVPDIAAADLFTNLQMVSYPVGCRALLNRPAVGSITFFCGTQSYNDGDALQFKYRATAPAIEGTGSFNGTVSAVVDGATKSNTIGGDKDVTVERKTFCAAFDYNHDDSLSLREIQSAISYFINNRTTPNGEKMALADIQALIAIYTSGGTCSGGVGGASIEGASLLPSEQGFFALLFGSSASQPAAVSRTASALEVQPGESFIVTATIKANQKLAGLALDESLPAGWTASLVKSDGYFKADDAIALWILTKAGATATVTYKVTVPADAEAGTYTISGLVSAGSPKFSQETGALQIAVVGSPVALQVKSISFSGDQFTVEGQGIAGIDARVYNLAGSLVFAEATSGNTLAFKGMNGQGGALLANGVYLYIVTVKGYNGQVVQSEVRKLVVLR